MQAGPDRDRGLKMFLRLVFGGFFFTAFHDKSCGLSCVFDTFTFAVNYPGVYCFEFHFQHCSIYYAAACFALPRRFIFRN